MPHGKQSPEVSEPRRYLKVLELNPYKVYEMMGEKYET